MKRIFHHPPESKAARKKYWRSFSELEDTPEFREALEREFPAGAAEMKLDGVSRRNFLKLMGASTALAGLGLSACRRPEQNLLPFTHSSEWEVPGKPLFYATAMPRRGGTMPLVVTTNDGRPTKVDGNPIHPVTQGSSDLFAQASVLSLYDPDRSRNFVHKGEESGEEDFLKYLDELLQRQGSSGGSMAFLVEENHSPTRERLREEIQRRFPEALWCIYEPVGAASVGAAQQMGFGDGVQTLLKVDEADVILALDSDFLGSDDQSAYYARQFAKRRSPQQEDGRPMNRLYVVENHYTVTGGMADHRLRLPASHVGAFAAALAKEIGGVSLPQLGGLTGEAASLKFPEGWIAELARDLAAARGRSLVLAGPRQPIAVQLLVSAINAALGNTGKTITGMQAAQKPGIDIARLAVQIASRRIDALFILGGNPAHNAPADLQWAELQAQVPDVIRLGMQYDETSVNSQWHVPAAHYLESWGDGRAVDGSYLSIQPMILPLFDGWSENDLLAVIAGRPKPKGPELVQETFRQLMGGGNFDAAWTKFLRDGFLANSTPAPRAIFFSGGGATSRIQDLGRPIVPAGEDAMEVVLVADGTLDDGRYANNAWMQETPDPVTKLTWDNAALMSPATAKRFEIKAPAGELGQLNGDVIKIEVGDQSIEAPVLISPGHADHSITIALGYGRKVGGQVAARAGFDAYPLFNTSSKYIVTGAKISKTGRSYPLAVTQDHWSMEGRGYVREGTVEQYGKEPDFAQRMWLDEETPAAGFKSLYTNPPLDGLHQWGMTVDLNTCTGCSACLAACQAENNIPVVGKQQVINGREMHWIRMDRYYASVEGHEDDPEMVTQPMLCQQCENAPCETVCPVNATIHNDEGLNVMAYNRCIGTRYCANNCPFKVRRFNFFDYNQRPIEQRQFGPFEVQGLYLGPLTKKGSPDTVKMQKNPNVTVRMRGVMEKCTFCVQRIQEAKIGAKVRGGASENVKVPVDSFKVACQQACPVGAIEFGDLSEPESRVSKLKAKERNYRLLEYLNVKTRVSYLAKIRNPNPRMPDARPLAAGPQEHEGGEGHNEPAHGAPAHAEPAHGGEA